jgi:drug/metabolite transporter superfamily protein YnfA
MIWFVIAVLAVANGIFRENILVLRLGQSIALPVSGMLLSIIVFIVTYLSFPLFGKNNAPTYFLIGLQWVLMTLIFEFIFGHYIMCKSWSDIFAIFNIVKGNLFIIVLIVSLFSPLLVAKIKSK